ncbi:hypothetical protein D3C78_1840900 [compost metagenome]
MKAKTNDPAFKYLFLCNKICGDGHYKMQKEVKVVSMAEYEAWLKEQPAYLTDDLRKEFNLPVAPAAPAPVDAAADTTAVKTNQLALKN